MADAHVKYLKAMVVEDLAKVEALCGKQISPRPAVRNLSTMRSATKFVGGGSGSEGAVSRIVHETIQNPATGKSMAVTKVFVVTPDNLLYQDVGWVHRSCTENCMVCNASFGIMNRKYNCFACGYVVCDTCSGRKAQIEQLQSPRLQPEECAAKYRVCTRCLKGAKIVSACVTPRAFDQHSSSTSHRGKMFLDEDEEEEAEANNAAKSSTLHAPALSMQQLQPPLPSLRSSLSFTLTELPNLVIAPADKDSVESENMPSEEYKQNVAANSTHFPDANRQKSVKHTILIPTDSEVNIVENNVFALQQTIPTGATSNADNSTNTNDDKINVSTPTTNTLPIRTNSATANMSAPSPQSTPRNSINTAPAVAPARPSATPTIAAKSPINIYVHRAPILSPQHSTTATTVKRNPIFQRPPKAATNKNEEKVTNQSSAEETKELAGVVYCQEQENNLWKGELVTETEDEITILEYIDSKNAQKGTNHDDNNSVSTAFSAQSIVCSIDTCTIS